MGTIVGNPALLNIQSVTKTPHYMLPPDYVGETVTLGVRRLHDHEAADLSVAADKLEESGLDVAANFLRAYVAVMRISPPERRPFAVVESEGVPLGIATYPNASTRRVVFSDDTRPNIIVGDTRELPDGKAVWDGSAWLIIENSITRQIDLR